MCTNKQDFQQQGSPAEITFVSDLKKQQISCLYPSRMLSSLDAAFVFSYMKWSMLISCSTFQ